MKKQFFFFILFFAFACNSYDGSEITAKYSDGQPMVKIYYRYTGNKKNVVREVRYYNNGKVMQDGGYDDKMRRHGKWTYFFDDGRIKSVEHYNHGLRDGKFVEYFRSGKKMWQGYYKNGLPEGTWYIYDENGKKISTEKYRNGVIILDKQKQK